MNGFGVDTAKAQIYWTDTASQVIMRANLDGTDPEGFVTDEVSGLAIDAALILQFSVGIIDTFPVDELIGLAPENIVPRHYQVSVPSLAAKRGERLTVPIAINDATGFLAGGVTLKKLYNAANWRRRTGMDVTTPVNGLLRVSTSIRCRPKISPPLAGC